MLRNGVILQRFFILLREQGLGLWGMFSKQCTICTQTQQLFQPRSAFMSRRRLMERLRTMRQTKAQREAGRVGGMECQVLR